MSSKLENEFQAKLIIQLRTMFPGCIIQKNKSSYQQGIPDLIILWEDRWATLECKKSADEPMRPNQPYFVQKMNEMSFSSFIFPENQEEVLHALGEAFRTAR